MGGDGSGKGGLRPLRWAGASKAVLSGVRLGGKTTSSGRGFEAAHTQHTVPVVYCMPPPEWFARSAERMGGIREVRLTNGSMSDAEWGGVAALVDGKAAGLERLSLEGMCVGAGWAPLFEAAFLNNASLQELNLGNNFVDWEAAAELVKVLMPCVGARGCLRRLSLAHNPELGSPGGTEVSRLVQGQGLRELDVTECMLLPSGAEALADALESDGCRLQTLVMEGNSVGAEGCEALCASLKGNVGLRVWNLARNNLKVEGAEHLAGLLRSPKCAPLTTLDLSFNALGDVGAAEVARALEGNPTVENLTMQRNAIGPKGAKALAGWVASATGRCAKLDLKHNSIKGADATELLAAVGVSKTLEELDLGENQLGDLGVVELAEALQANTTCPLKRLDLGKNGITDAGAQILAAALLTNAVLTVLSLKGNSVSEAGAQALAEVLRANSSLTSLDVSGNDLGPEGAGYLAAGLRENEGLLHLGLADNDLEDEGAARLAAALWCEDFDSDDEEIQEGNFPPFNSHLRILVLSGNELSSHGARELAMMLAADSCPILKLDLSNNVIDADGAEDLCKGLGENPTPQLTTLDLHENAVGDKGAKCFASLLEDLKVKQCLEVLDLSGNGITGVGSLQLAKSLRKNRTLTRLALAGNLGAADENSVAEFASALMRNPVCTTLDLCNTGLSLGTKGRQQGTTHFNIKSLRDSRADLRLVI